jgi:hypothetical protein
VNGCGCYKALVDRCRVIGLTHWSSCLPSEYELSSYSAGLTTEIVKSRWAVDGRYIGVRCDCLFEILSLEAALPVSGTVANNQQRAGW